MGLKVSKLKGVTGKMSMSGIKKTPAKRGQFVTPAASPKK